MNSLSSFRKAPCARAMGIEIECQVPRVIAPELNTHCGFFFCGADISIDWKEGHCAREFVSQPLTQPWLKKEIAKLYKKFPWSWDNSCGIHIHVNRKWLSVHKAKAIYDFLLKVDHIDLEHVFGRQPNDYCRMHRPLWGVTRYCAINTHPAHTIEFRMFASGNAAWASYCVDCVAYLIDNAYRLNIDAFLAFRDSYKDL